MFTVLVSIIIIVCSSSDDINDILGNVNMNAVKQRFQPNDLNALVNNMNNPNIDIDINKDVKPHWNAEYYIIYDKHIIS